MKGKLLGLTVLLATFAGSALAQTHISSNLKCGKADVQHTVEVGDHPGHVLILQKGPCTWATPFVIAGMKGTAHFGTMAADVDGATFQDRGYGVTTMENGDKIYVRVQDSGTATKDGKAVTYTGTWSYTGGTGKFKGIKGKGTYKGSGDPEGEVNSQVEGEYTLPGASNPGK